MVEYRWSVEKNNKLKADANRGICFEDIVSAIKNGGLLADIEHTNKIKYRTNACSSS